MILSSLERRRKRRKTKEKKEAGREQMKMFGKEEVKVFLKEKRIPFRWVEHKAVYTIEEMEELGLEKWRRRQKSLFARPEGKKSFSCGNSCR